MCYINVVLSDRNDIGDEGGGHLRDGLRANKSLTHLWIIDCKIGDIGGKAIGQVSQRKLFNNRQ